MTESYAAGGDRDRREISGVICTLNPEYADDKTERGKIYVETLDLLTQSEETFIRIPLPCQPKQAILHVYLSIAGRIEVRLAFSHVEDGEARKVYDGRVIHPKFWAVCTGPVSRAPERILRRELSRSRYTEALW